MNQPIKTPAPKPADQPYDASDAVQVGLRQSKAQKRELMVKEGLRQAMSTSEGRAFLFDLIDFCGANRNPFSTHSNTMSFNAGQMNVGQKITADIMAAGLEAEWLLMGRESR